MRDFRYLPGVTTLTLDVGRCIGCGLCPLVCPHGVLQMKEGKAAITDLDGCMECGACALNCPAKALHVQAGVGCAAAILTGWLTGGPPRCGCDDDGSPGGCC